MFYTEQVPACDKAFCKICLSIGRSREEKEVQERISYCRGCGAFLHARAFEILQWKDGAMQWKVTPVRWSIARISARLERLLISILCEENQGEVLIILKNAQRIFPFLYEEKAHEHPFL
jgi:hypothetical protein